MLCRRVLLGIFWMVPVTLPASTTTIDFEGLADSTFLSTQYSGVVFSNAQILTAGVSLNELKIPPHSGVNVAADDSGPMSLFFPTSSLW